MRCNVNSCSNKPSYCPNFLHVHIRDDSRIRVTIGGAIWPEIYGVNNLGGIRALATFFMVLSTAIAPVSMGYLIDAGVTMELIALGCFIYMTFSSIAAWFGVRIKNNSHT